MRNVMIVVLVLMMSCHVSLKPNIGPVSSQTTIIADAMENATGRPVIVEHHCARKVKVERGLGFAVMGGVCKSRDLLCL